MAADGPESAPWIGRTVLKLDDGDVCATLQKVIELKS